jgi:hypothetical protein
MRGIGAAFLFTAFIGIAGLTQVALAQPAGDSYAALSESEVERRIAFIEERLDASRRHAQIWYWSWLAINGGATVGLSAASVLTDNGDDRASYIPQAVLAALGVADLTLIRPLDARLGAAPIRALPAATPAERRAQLERAEAQLRSNAERAASRRSVLLHVASLGLNGAAGLATWAFGEPGDALVSFLSGAAAGELYIWTEPGAPARDWQDYQRFAAHAATAPVPRWSVVGGFGRIALKLEW